MEEAAPAPGPSLVDQAQETMAGHMEALQTHWDTYNAPPVACAPAIVDTAASLDALACELRRRQPRRAALDCEWGDGSDGEDDGARRPPSLLQLSLAPDETTFLLDVNALIAARSRDKLACVVGALLLEPTADEDDDDDGLGAALAGTAVLGFSVVNDARRLGALLPAARAHHVGARVVDIQRVAHAAGGARAAAASRRAHGLRAAARQPDGLCHARTGTGARSPRRPHAAPTRRSRRRRAPGRAGGRLRARRATCRM